MNDPESLTRLAVRHILQACGLPHDFTGYVQLNMFKGGVTNVNINLSMKFSATRD
jgi:hypothetical protein